MRLDGRVLPPKLKDRRGKRMRIVELDRTRGTAHVLMGECHCGLDGLSFRKRTVVSDRVMCEKGGKR